jgi:FAD/FMN-containing dehydrogenase
VTTFLKKITRFLGDNEWIDASNSNLWSRDWLDKFGEIPIGVAIPSSTNQVSNILKLCYNYEVSVIPQGGNTSLVGGSVSNKKGGLILSMSRMNDISSPDLIGRSVEVGSGVILENLHKELKKSNMILPMHLGSQGSAQIGGLISTNAGGTHAFKYGMMQDLVLGMEVVLPGGQVWNGMRSVQKDNTGYQLRKIFCGAEGSLGVITKAILKLTPAPKKQITALVSFNDINSLIKVASNIRSEIDEFITAIEFFSDSGLKMIEKHISGFSIPIRNRASFYLLLEASTSTEKISLESIFSFALEKAMKGEDHVDAIVALTNKQRAQLWRLREDQPEGQRLSGAQLKHDISVPPAHIQSFLETANKNCQRILKGVRINAFGHIGDGNIHYNISPPTGKKDFLNTDKDFELMIAKLAAELGGSFAAEHGIGTSKVDLAETLRDYQERDIMRSIKRSFDQKALLNPGVVVHEKD